MSADFTHRDQTYRALQTAGHVRIIRISIRTNPNGTTTPEFRTVHDTAKSRPRAGQPLVQAAIAALAIG